MVIENGIIIIKDGVARLAPLPSYGNVEIKIHNGKPKMIDVIKESIKLEDLPGIILANLNV